MNTVSYEVEQQVIEGMTLIPLSMVRKMLSDLGYRIDLPCTCIARIMSGPRAGESYPCKTYHITHKSTGLSWADCDLPRDAAWHKVKAIRFDTISRCSKYVISF